MSDIERVIELIENASNSLHAEMHAGFSELKSKISDLEVRFDRQEARFERHAGLLQTGSRWVNRMNQWAERVDRILAQRDAKIQDLYGRLRKLEENREQGPANR